MKKEWGTLATLGVSGVVGALLVLLMFTYTENPKEYSRDAKLTDGTQADWRDRTASLLYSPGELHAAHFKSEINCQNCHTPAKQVSSEYCITCHSEKDFKLHTSEAVVADMHLTIAQTMSCFSCHTEHKGLGGRISQTLDLEGHQHLLSQSLQEDCKQCHSSDYKTAHPNMINKDCDTCHKLEDPFTYKVHTFRHTDVEVLDIDPDSADFIKLPYPDQGQCEDCHQPDFHVGEKGIPLQAPASVEGEFDCLSCHNLKKTAGGLNR